MTRRPTAPAVTRRKPSPSSPRSLPGHLAVAALQHVNDGVFVVDADNRIIAWTESATRLFHLPSDAAVGRRFADVLPFAIEVSSEEQLLAATRVAHGWHGRGPVTLPDGTVVWVDVSLAAVSLPGHAAAAVAVSRDVTRQRQDDLARAAAERALRALSQLNRELVRETEERALLQSACRIAVEVGGYRVAWVGYATDDPGALLEPVAAAANDLGAMGEADMAWVRTLDGDEPARTAMHTGQPSVRGLAEAGAPGVQAGLVAAAVPLRNGGQPIGALTVYSERADAFSASEIELLGEFSADLAYGVAARRAEAAHAITVRQARADELVATQLRIGLSAVVQQVDADAPLDAIADTVCRQFAALPGIDSFGVGALISDDEVDLIAAAVPDGWPPLRSQMFTPDVVHFLRERVAGGAFVADAENLRAMGWTEIPAQVGAIAFGPIVHGDHVDGGIGLGIADAELARTLVERLPAVAAYSATASGLLAERLHTHRQQVARRRQLEKVVATLAFHPVFQVLVDLRTREPVGYEALTRLDSGEEPAAVFTDAWSLGLGPDLELATLEAAVTAARADLPPGVWLTVNVSPRLLLQPTDLRGILGAAGHPVVVEVTEHEVVTDYEGVRSAVRRLGKDVRLAVDDAGAGVANFGHIIELNADFVKLDMSLVRRVNAHLGRQALVVGMRRFALHSGCRLIAEGIETELEAATLLELGVEFGQGYLFGTPGPVRVPGDPSMRRPRAARHAARS